MRFDWFIAQLENRWAKIVLTHPIMCGDGHLMTTLQGKLSLHQDCVELGLVDGTSIAVRLDSILAVCEHEGDVISLEQARVKALQNKQINDVLINKSLS